MTIKGTKRLAEIEKILIETNKKIREISPYLVTPMFTPSKFVKLKVQAYDKICNLLMGKENNENEGSDLNGLLG